MSRDWTPKEQLAAEKILEGKTWLDVSKSMTIVLNGKETPMCPPDYCDFLEQFNYLKRIGYDAIFPIYKKYGQSCLETIQDIEHSLAEYIEHDKSLIPWVCDWYNGELDTGFYYAEQNNERFCEYIEEELNTHLWQKAQELAKEEYEATSGNDWEEADKLEKEDYVFDAYQKLTNPIFLQGR